MFMRKERSILETDFSSIKDDMENWEQMRTKKISLWRSYQAYIDLLDNMYKNETNSFKKRTLRKQMKKMLREQKKFAVEPILSFDMDLGKKKVLKNRK